MPQYIKRCPRCITPIYVNGSTHCAKCDTALVTTMLEVKDDTAELIDTLNKTRADIKLLKSKPSYAG